jgi:hypothetical protein
MTIGYHDEDSSEILFAKSDSEQKIKRITRPVVYSEGTPKKEKYNK